jgi:gamma-glutamylcyclotransferase (GGCT)/AIG2-like uncharacterized protein YtfP
VRETAADLERALGHVNSARSMATGDEAARCTALMDALNVLLDFPDTRLAAYGTLAPGESNHAMLAGVPGDWLTGTVRGVLFMAHGYPAFEPRPGKGQVPVSVLTAVALPEHWARLDEFEGVDYRRILVPVTLSNGTIVVANLYEYIGGVA